MRRTFINCCATCKNAHCVILILNWVFRLIVCLYKQDIFILVSFYGSHISASYSMSFIAKLYFLNCYLAAPQPTLGYCRGSSVPKLIFITAFRYWFWPEDYREIYLQKTFWNFFENPQENTSDEVMFNKGRTLMHAQLRLFSCIVFLFCGRGVFLRRKIVNPYHLNVRKLINHY